KIVKAIVECDNAFVVICVGAPKDARSFEAISTRVVVIDDIPLELAMYLVSNADCFIGVDSCMLHVADLAKIPSIGIFGPTRICEFGIRFSEQRFHISISLLSEETIIESILVAIKDLFSR